MKKVASLFILTVFSFTTLFEGGNLAFAVPATAVGVGTSATQGGNQSAQLSQLSSATGGAQSFQPDLFTGRAQTSIPIFVPPGRKNVQPNLNLSYSSSAGNGWLGMGWALDLGFIQRNTKNGVPKYNSTDTFIFSFQGVTSELIHKSGDEYVAKDEALFLKFTRDETNDKWTVTDKSGTKHIFGETASCKQPGPGSNNTFRWQLSKVVDLRGNYMSVSHVLEDGHTYLDKVEYNGNETQSFLHTHRVRFLRDPAPREDIFFSYISGAKDEVKKRLQTIEVEVKNSTGGWDRSRQYNLTYTYSSSTGRSLLTSLTECGTDGIECFPAQTFTYQQPLNEFNDFLTPVSNIQRFGSSPEQEYDLGKAAINTGSAYVDFLDMNGDGLSDRIMSDQSGAVAHYEVQINDIVNTGSFKNKEIFGSANNLQNAFSGDINFISYNSDSSPGPETSTALIDMNGDGLPDRIMSVNGVPTEKWQIQFNVDGTGFAAKVDWPGAQAYPGTVNFPGASVRYHHIRFTVPQSYTVLLADLVDMNGDGLPDRIIADVGAESAIKNWFIQLNNGTGFDAGGVWLVERPPNSTNIGYRDAIRVTTPVNTEGTITVTELIDLNGDGLPDRVHSEDTGGTNTHWYVQWNTGSSFTSLELFYGPVPHDPTSDFMQHIRLVSNTGEARADLFDINGDGLPDRIKAKDSNLSWEVLSNLGNGFDSTYYNFGNLHRMLSDNVRFDYPRWHTLDAVSPVDMADITGDGIADRCQSWQGETSWKIQEKKGPHPDLLSTVHNGWGAVSTLTYKKSTEYDNTEEGVSIIEKLPFPVWTVSQVDQIDGLGNTYTTNYDYVGGMFDPTEREFRGFREVTVTDAVGTETRHTFHQEDHKRGRLKTKEVWGHTVDLNGVLDTNSALQPFTKEINTWSVTEPHGAGLGSYFVRLDEVVSQVYDGDSIYKEIRQRFDYDSYGNLTETIEDGDTSITTDDRRTVNQYVYSVPLHILNTLKRSTLYDAAVGGAVMADRVFFYDAAGSIDTAPIRGELTKDQEWLNTNCVLSFPSTDPAPCHPTTEISYDAYGNVLTLTDALGRVTTNKYDDTYHLFLEEIKNPLWQLANDPNHKRTFTHDPLLAQVTASTDLNNVITQTSYDPLGRVKKVAMPGDSLTEPTQEFIYDDPTVGCEATNSCVSKVTIRTKSSQASEAYAYLESFSFKDGLGREIQMRSPAENSANQVVTGSVSFNSRGEIEYEYHPYFESISSTYVPPSPTAPRLTYAYDALGRRTRIDFPDTTFSKVSFNDFEKTTTDQRTKDKRYTSDAYGRLVKVEEFNLGSTYTTSYSYDALDNLTQTLDEGANPTGIVYDSLSRKISMTDPDMGAWFYEYDENNNLTKQTDAKSQVITFSYDELNRVTLKDLPGVTDDVTYVYDGAPATYTGQSGYIGRLAKVEDPSGDHEFLYDLRGRVIKDTKTIDSFPYEFIRTYDSLDRVRTLEYPDAEVVTYTYNGFGDVETIASSATSYISNVDYDASGQINKIIYGNGVVSDYDYDEATLRLDEILTQKGEVSLQDLTYGFDNNGNVTSIGDLIHDMTQTFQYDDLNRLTWAEGTAYNNQVAVNYTYNAIGNLETRGNRTMTYGASAGPHAVTAITSTDRPSFCPPAPASCELIYDNNGNMTNRGNDTLVYDAENRLKQITVPVGTSGQHNFNLAEDWNLISFTYLPSDKSISNVLSGLTFGVDYDQVSYWDPVANEWKHYVNDPDFNDFDTFEYGKSYEINVIKTGGVNFTVSGNCPGAIPYNIVLGSNFVTPAIKTTQLVSTVLADLTPSDYSDVKKLDPVTQALKSYSVGDFSSFEPGVGYIIEGLQNAVFNYSETTKVTDYVYDSSGARVKKIVNGASPTIYLGKDFVKESTGTTTKYIFLGDMRVASKDSMGKQEFIHSDHISSSNIITNELGVLQAKLEYWPYGVSATDTSDTRYKFTGQEEDDEANLYYYGARYYDPEIGRFVSPDWIVQDPANSQSLNRYAYAFNNPIKYNDPTGNYSDNPNDQHININGSGSDQGRSDGGISGGGSWSFGWDDIKSCFGLCGGKDRSKPKLVVLPKPPLTTFRWTPGSDEALIHRRKSDLAFYGLQNLPANGAGLGFPNAGCVGAVPICFNMSGLSRPMGVDGAKENEPDLLLSQRGAKVDPDDYEDEELKDSGVKDRLTGGKKNQRDKNFGIDDKRFWKSWERYKRKRGLPDIQSKKEALERKRQHDTYNDFI